MHRETVLDSQTFRRQTTSKEALPQIKDTSAKPCKFWSSYSGPHDQKNSKFLNFLTFVQDTKKHFTKQDALLQNLVQNFTIRTPLKERGRETNREGKRERERERERARARERESERERESARDRE
jgi:hypothetical protein